MIPNQDAWRETLMKLEVVRNLSLVRLRKTQIATRAPMTPISSIAMIRRATLDAFRPENPRVLVAVSTVVSPIVSPYSVLLSQERVFKS
jgi:hypothetical protein